MKKSLVFILFVYNFLLCPLPVSAVPAADIASRWSPVICQIDTGSGLTAQQNMFTLVNYDRDWRLNNNWYNLLFYSLEQVVYYSVVESDTHYFIGYYQYYPRHVGRAQYEHDMTGMLLAVAKTPDQTGQLDMLLTYSNKQWRQWPGSKVHMEGRHPVLNIRAGSHEITTAGGSSRVLPVARIYESPVSDELGGPIAKVPPGGAHAGYRLVPLAALWERRQDIGQGRVFASWGVFDTYNEAQVTVPWVWEYRRLNWLKQPGELVRYFQGQPVQACNYLSNPY